MESKLHCFLVNLFCAIPFVFISAGTTAQSLASGRAQPLRDARAAAPEASIAAYVAQARRSYPAAKHRFLQGLPTDETFFIAIQLKDAKGRLERVFLRVTEIRGTVVYGTIANDIVLVEGFKAGQWYSTEESELLDWLIAGPDGREEGNFVGKFLDSRNP